MSFDAARGLAALVLLIAAGYIVYVIWSYTGGRGAMYCTTCHYRGDTSKRVHGSLLVELILWFCAILPAAALHQLPLTASTAVVYGVLGYSFAPALIYSAWRMSTRHRVCGLCRHPLVVPLESPVAVASAPPPVVLVPPPTIHDPILDDAVARQRPD
jgi:hypothetical protein